MCHSSPPFIFGSSAFGFLLASSTAGTIFGVLAALVLSEPLRKPSIYTGLASVVYPSALVVRDPFVEAKILEEAPSSTLCRCLDGHPRRRTFRTGAAVWLSNLLWVCLRLDACPFTLGHRYCRFTRFTCHLLWNIFVPSVTTCGRYIFGSGTTRCFAVKAVHVALPVDFLLAVFFLQIWACCGPRTRLGWTPQHAVVSATWPPPPHGFAGGRIFEDSERSRVDSPRGRVLISSARFIPCAAPRAGTSVSAAIVASGAAFALLRRLFQRCFHNGVFFGPSLLPPLSTPGVAVDTALQAAPVFAFPDLVRVHA